MEDMCKGLNRLVQTHSALLEHTCSSRLYRALMACAEPASCPVPLCSSLGNTAPLVQCFLPDVSCCALELRLPFAASCLSSPERRLSFTSEFQTRVHCRDSYKPCQGHSYHLLPDRPWGWTMCRPSSSKYRNDRELHQRGIAGFVWSKLVLPDWVVVWVCDLSNTVAFSQA